MSRCHQTCTDCVSCAGWVCNRWHCQCHGVTQCAAHWKRRSCCSQTAAGTPICGGNRHVGRVDGRLPAIVRNLQKSEGEFMIPCICSNIGFFLIGIFFLFRKISFSGNFPEKENNRRLENCPNPDRISSHDFAPQT